MSPWKLVGAVGFGAVLLLVSGCRNDVLGRKGAFVVEPQSLNFPTTAVGSATRRSLVVRNEARTPFQVVSVDLHAPWIRVEAELPITVEGGTEKTVEVLFAPLQEGEVEGSIDVVTDVAPEAEAASFQVPMRGKGVIAEVAFEPTRLDFGNVELGTRHIEQLVLANPSEAELSARLHLEGPEARSFEGGELEVQLAPGERRVLPVSFQPDQLAVSQAFMRAEPCTRCAATTVELVGFGISSVLDIQPLRVVFGRVPLGSSATETIQVTNLGSTPLDFGGAALSTGEPFSVTSPEPQVLAPGQTLTIDVAFAPVHEGAVAPALLELRVRGSNTAASSYPRLPVVAEVGPTCVVAVPKLVDFGMVPEDMSVTRRVDFLNRCGEDVVVSDLSIDTDSGGFLSLAQAARAMPIASGGIASTRVSFVPRVGSGQTSGRLSFRVRQGAALARGEVGLKGLGRALPACQYSVAPAALDFGPVQVGEQLSLGWAIKNDGATPCFVSGMQLASGSDPEVTATPVASLTIEPGQKAVLPLTFQPGRTGKFTALAEAWVNHPTLGHVTALIEGEGVRACLTLQPGNVNFGPTPLSCGSKRRSVAAVNACAVPVTLSSMALGQATSNEFSLVGGPSLPVTLQPGTQVGFTVEYRPSDDGVDHAAIQAVGSAVGSTSASLTGMGLSSGLYTDRFVQDSLGRVDVLFVVDNSGSMMEEQVGLAQNLTSFFALAQSMGVDYHMAVTTTGIEPSPGGWSTCPGGAEGGEAGRFFPANNTGPRIITRSMQNGVQAFANNVKVGTCHWNEQGLEAAYRALSAPLVNGIDDPRTPLVNDGNLGFLRSDARLAIVVISDEDDFSPQPVSFYESFFRSLKGGDASLLSFSAIVGPKNLSQCPTASGSGLRYLELAQSTGGSTESICTPSWSNSLQNVAGSTFGPNRRFPLTERPSNPSAIEVSVDGVVLSSGWTYDPIANAIVFDPSAIPAPGSSIEVRYPVGC